MSAVVSVAAASLRSRIDREGPLRHSDFVRAALYGPDGFYSNGHGAGHRRDFVTSPEVGALFGTLLATALDTWWRSLGEPDPFLVADCGAGPGTLAVSVLAARPECSRAIRLVLVESSPTFRELHRHRRLPMVEPHELFGDSVGGVDRSGMGRSDHDGENHGGRAVTGAGPLCTSLANLPEHSFHVVVANELLDNLPFDVLERTARGWAEVRIGAGPDGFHAVPVPCPDEQSALANRLVPGAVAGDRIPVLVDAHTWLADALMHLQPRGRLVCIDYGAPTAELARRDGGWLRTYRDHARGSDALADPGATDITIDVPIDQLVPYPGSMVSQAAFLTELGIGERVAEADRFWTAHRASGRLDALKAKSVGHEAAVLTDPGGLGAFNVMQWIR